jgi:hypothetical protein
MAGGQIRSIARSDWFPHASTGTDVQACLLPPRTKNFTAANKKSKRNQPKMMFQIFQKLVENPI